MALARVPSALSSLLKPLDHPVSTHPLYLPPPLLAPALPAVLPGCRGFTTPFPGLGTPSEAPFCPSPQMWQEVGSREGPVFQRGPAGHTRLPTGPRSPPCRSHVLGKPGGRPCMSPAPCSRRASAFQPSPPLTTSSASPPGAARWRLTTSHNTSCPRACRTGLEEASSGRSVCSQGVLVVIPAVCRAV